MDKKKQTFALEPSSTITLKLIGNGPNTEVKEVRKAGTIQKPGIELEATVRKLIEHLTGMK